MLKVSWLQKISFYENDHVYSANDHLMLQIPPLHDNYISKTTTDQIFHH